MSSRTETREAADPVTSVAARAANMAGERAAVGWSPEQTVAWEGLLEVAARLRRRGEQAALAAHGDVTLGMLGVMGRLLRADAMTLQESEIAADMGRSLSRVSRLVDNLEGRGLVRRSACPGDRRAIHITLEPAGADLTRDVQGTVFEFVQASFFDALDDSEVDTLAAVFARLIRRTVGAGEPADGAG